ncbi:MAG TPA: hypothetical protein VJV79_39340 [Polyangiaceae bacterium]|nr:hypothetical protein [Polyangiaceae bacterium]
MITQANHRNALEALNRVLGVAQLVRNLLDIPMTRVLEIPLDLIHEDELRPNERGRIVHDHAIRYFQRVAPMFPAVVVRVEGEAIKLARGSDYLALARDLGMSKIRSVVVDSSTSAVDRAKQVHGLAELDVGQDLEAAMPDEHWHVFVFDGAITSMELAAFERTVLTLFDGTASGMALQDGGHRIEFCAPSPLENRDWLGEFISRCKEFSDTTREIVSYQGRRPPWKP